MILNIKIILMTFNFLLDLIICPIDDDTIHLHFTYHDVSILRHEYFIFHNKLTFTNYLPHPVHLLPSPSCYPKVSWIRSILHEVHHDLDCQHQSLCESHL